MAAADRVPDSVLTAIEYIAGSGEPIVIGEANARDLVAEIRHHRIVEQKAHRVVELATPGEAFPPLMSAIEELREVLRNGKEAG